jgi:NADPH-dependent glutamate synthase beta subunit-like oxidoreductase
VHLGGDLGRTGGTVVEAVADGRRAAGAIDARLRDR